jgi:hypothetical protein
MCVNEILTRNTGNRDMTQLKTEKCGGKKGLTDISVVLQNQET